jgi:hypothetical protein
MTIDRRRMDIMRICNRIVIAILASLCLVGTGTAATKPATGSVSIQIFPESSYLDLDSADHSATLRQTSTPVRISLPDVPGIMSGPTEIYAFIPTDEAMRLSGNSSTLSTASIRIRNDQGAWTALEPLAQLEGRRGVRIAVLSKSSATILLQVQLQVPAGQVPGTYQGVLTLEAQER